MPLTELSNLDVAEVSLVNQGANRRRFMLWKSKDGKPMASNPTSMNEQLQAAIAATSPEVLSKVDGAMKDHLEKMKKDASDAAQNSTDQSGVVASAVRAVARILSPFKDKIPSILMHNVLDQIGFAVEEGEEPGATEQHAETHVTKSAEDQEDGYDTNHDTVGPIADEPIAGEGPSGTIGQGETMPDHIEMMKKDFQAIPAEILKKAMDGDHSALMDHVSKLGYQKYPSTQPAMKSKESNMAGTVTKSADGTAQPNLAKLDPETKAQLEAVFKSHQELVQKNANLTSEVAALHELNRQREIVAKAATFTNLGLPQDSLVKILGTAHKAGTEHYEQVCKSYETMNEQMGASSRFGNALTAEIGSSLPRNGGQGTGNAWEAIEKAAEGIVQKSAGALSKEEAMAQYLSSPAGKQAYAQHQAGREKGI